MLPNTPQETRPKEAKPTSFPIKGIAFLVGGLLVGGLLGFFVLWSGGALGRGNIERRLPPAVGSAAPDFTLNNLAGEDIHLSDLRGQPVVVNFWATWCPPCKEEMPLLERASRQYEDRVTIIGVDYAEQQDVVEVFISEMEITFPILLDRTGSVSDLYFVRNYPTTFFLDAEGVVRAQHIGMLDEELLARYLGTIGIKP